MANLLEFLYLISYYEYQVQVFGALLTEFEMKMLKLNSDLWIPITKIYKYIYE